MRTPFYTRIFSASDPGDLLRRQGKRARHEPADTAGREAYGKFASCACVVVPFFPHYTARISADDGVFLCVRVYCLLCVSLKLRMETMGKGMSMVVTTMGTGMKTPGRLRATLMLLTGRRETPRAPRCACVRVCDRVFECVCRGACAHLFLV